MLTSREPPGATEKAPAPGRLLRRCACGQHSGTGECAECRKSRLGRSLERSAVCAEAPEVAPASVRQTLVTGGQPLDGATRAHFERGFGRDFSRVRVHNDAGAARSASEVSARAYTVGSHVAFGAGQYQPRSAYGQRLLGHELAHVAQQEGSPTSGEIRIGRTDSPAEREAEGAAGALERGHTPTLRRSGSALARAPAAKEPADHLCPSYTYASKKALIEGLIDGQKTAPAAEGRLSLVRELKWIWRCGTDAEKTEIRSKLEAGLGTKAAAAIWKEAGTAFGGYRGVYPGYYGSAKGRLKQLGVSEAEGFNSFPYDIASKDKAAFAAGGRATATAEASTIEATDLLYFYGHQYAQLKFPGVFANGTQTQFVDLRALAGKGDFSRVKLIVSTSCATCCKEAVETFAPLFPNAAILGYRKSAPSHGDAVRDAFDKGIQGLKRPLLLDQPIDMEAIISVWRSVMERFHPKEKERLPGYYQNGTVHYLEMGVWKSMVATEAGNSCRKKGSGLEEAAH